MTAVRLSAPAKLTLSLRVVGLRGDGYHLVDAEMVAIDLSDRLVISNGDGLQVVAADGGLEVVGGGDNLVAAALRLAGLTADVVVHKVVPAGAGLAVPPDDLDALVAAVEHLADNPDLRATMGAAGRRWAERWRSPASVAEAYAELVKGLQNRS